MADKNTRIFNGFTNLEQIEFKVPNIRLVTGCVSQRRDGRYCFSLRHFPLHQPLPLPLTPPLAVPLIPTNTTSTAA
jgi:hypothetical protein